MRDCTSRSWAKNKPLLQVKHVGQEDTAPFAMLPKHVALARANQPVRHTQGSLLSPQLGEGLQRLFQTRLFGRQVLPPACTYQPTHSSKYNSGARNTACDTQLFDRTESAVPTKKGLVTRDAKLHAQTVSLCCPHCECAVMLGFCQTLHGTFVDNPRPAAIKESMAQFRIPHHHVAPAAFFFF